MKIQLEVERPVPSGDAAVEDRVASIGSDTTAAGCDGTAVRGDATGIRVDEVTDGRDDAVSVDSDATVVGDVSLSGDATVVGGDTTCRDDACGSATVGSGDVSGDGILEWARSKLLRLCAFSNGVSGCAECKSDGSYILLYYSMCYCRV